MDVVRPMDDFFGPQPDQHLAPLSIPVDTEKHDPVLDIGTSNGYWMQDSTKPFERIGVIDTAEGSGIQACVNGWNGEPKDFSFHYCWTADEAKAWLLSQGATRIIDKTGD